MKFATFPLVLLAALIGLCNSQACSAVDNMCPSPGTKRTMAQVTKPAPLWSAKAAYNGEIKTMSLEEFRGRFVVVVFYPKDFTFVCPTELLAFSDRLEEFNKLEADVIGVSVDNEFSHLAWTNLARKKGGLEGIKIPLVSDITKEISRSYDVLIEEEGVALRGLFIIDPNGIIRVKHVNDFPIGRSVDEALRLVEAIRYHEKHGEDCPANWKQGLPAIQPDPVHSKKYFEEFNSGKK